jgi:hypothetical protein
VVATVPATVTIPAGQSSANFSLTTNPLAVLTNVTVTATYGGVSKTANLAVTPL